MSIFPHCSSVPVTHQVDTSGCGGPLTQYLSVTSRWHPECEVCHGAIPRARVPDNITRHSKVRVSPGLASVQSQHAAFHPLPNVLRKGSTFLSPFSPSIPPCAHCNFSLPSMPYHYPNAALLSTVTRDSHVIMAPGLFLVPSYLFLPKVDHLFYLFLHYNI